MLATRERTRHALLDRAERYLDLTWRDDALFPYSTRLVDGRLVHDYEHPHTRRYTINSLLGLRDPEKTEAFVRLQLPRVTNPGDLGLAAVLLGERVALDGAEPQTMQERCWLVVPAPATSPRVACVVTSLRQPAVAFDQGALAVVAALTARVL